MDAFDLKNKEPFKDILKSASKVSLSDGFTESIMNQLEVIGAKNRVFNKYMNRSYVFFLLAIMLALCGIFALNYIELSVHGTLNNFIAKSFEFYIYLLISALSGLLFYHLNNLLSYRFAQVK